MPQLLCPINLQHVSKIIRVDHEVQVHVYLWQFQSKMPICIKGGVFEKLTDTMFAHLLFPTLLQHLEKTITVNHET